MTDMPDYPVVELPGSEGWAAAYDYGKVLDRRFPGHDGGVLAIAIEYNDAGPATQEITNLVLNQRGERDGESWVWTVEFADGTTWTAVGWCDYTGWDCRSSLKWTRE